MKKQKAAVPSSPEPMITPVEALSEDQIRAQIKGLQGELAEKTRSLFEELERRERVAYDKEQTRLDDLASFVVDHSLSLLKFVPDHDREAHDYDVEGTDEALSWEGMGSTCARCALYRASEGYKFEDHVLVLSVERRER